MELIKINSMGVFISFVKTIDYVKKKNVKSNAIAAVR